MFNQLLRRRMNSKPRSKGVTQQPLRIEQLEHRLVLACNNLTGNITANLNDTVNVYCLTGDVTIPAGNNVTIGSGVVVRTDDRNFDISVRGDLTATGAIFAGAETDITVFTGGTLILQSGTSIDGDTVEYQGGSLGRVSDSTFGSARLRQFSDAVTVDRSTFTGPRPVTTLPSSVPDFYDNTFATPATIGIIGRATKNASWQVIPNLSDYLMGDDTNFGSGSITVNTNVVLTIQAGIIFRTERIVNDFIVNGSLEATGVRLSGFFDLRAANGGRLNLTNSALTGSNVNYLGGSRGTISCSAFSSGLSIDDQASLTAARNDFSSPSAIVTASGSSSVVIDLRNQWWGTTDPDLIGSKIRDRNDAPLNTRPLVDFNPPLARPPACNDPPSAAASPSRLTIEAGAGRTVTLSGVDPETASGDLRFTITAAPANGTLKIGSTILGNGATVTGSPVDVIYAANANYSGPDSFQFKVTDRGDPDNCTGGLPDCAQPLDSDVVTVAITVVPNDAPVLDNRGSMTLAAINEDNVSNTGTLVSAIIASAQPPDRITDLNAGAVEGLAVIAVENTNGQWQFSTDNGTNWSAFGAPSGTSARLLASDSSTRVRFVPNADFNGLVATGLTFRAWDQTSDSNGATADVSTNGGTTAFSTATETASIRVTAQPDSPVAAGDAYVIEQDIALVVSSTGVLSNDIDVDGDTITAILVNGPTGGRVTLNSDGSFSYTANPGFAGVDSFTYRASDGTLDSSEATVSITVVALASCTPTLGSGSLVAGPLGCLGTRSADQIQISLKGDAIEVRFVKPFKSRATFPLASVSRIVVRTLEGNDSVQIASNVTVPAWLFGGPGNDTLQASRGSENNVLVGDDGNDSLEAGTDRLNAGEGRDLLIGGRGRDHLRASAGDNLLVAGFTDYDGNMTALQAIMNEWTRADQTYQRRVDHLLTGGGLNGTTRLNPTTVHDDGDVDVLDGAPQTIWLDWFFANLDGDGDKKKKDKVNGLTGGRVATDIDVP